MLTGYTFCIPIKNKSAEEIVTAWRNHIAFLFGVCRKLLMDNGTEWDDIVPLTTASYNWLPNQHSKESLFFVMFGRDAVTNLSQLTKPKLRYMGTEDLILDLELMSNIFQTQIHNLRMA